MGLKYFWVLQNLGANIVRSHPRSQCVVGIAVEMTPRQTVKTGCTQNTKNLHRRNRSMDIQPTEAENSDHDEGLELADLSASDSGSDGN